MPQGFNLTASRGTASHRELFQATQDHCHSREKAGAGMTVTGSVKPGLQSVAAEREICWRARRQCALSLLPALLGVEIPGTCKQMSGQVYDSQQLPLLQPFGVVHDLQKSIQITDRVWDRESATLSRGTARVRCSTWDRHGNDRAPLCPSALLGTGCTLQRDVCC